MYSKLSNDKFFLVKFAAVILISLVISFISNCIFLGLILCGIIFIYLISGIELKRFYSDIKIMFFIYIFSSLLIYIFEYMNYTELFIITLRMTVLLSAFSLFLRTTHINNLINFMSKYCSQRKVFALCASLKFLPLLGSEMKDIYFLQKNRGVKLKFRNFINGSYFICLIIPFIVVSLKIISNLILTAHIKKLDFSKKRTSIYESCKLKKIMNREVKL